MSVVLLKRGGAGSLDVWGGAQNPTSVKRIEREAGDVRVDECRSCSVKKSHFAQDSMGAGVS